MNVLERSSASEPIEEKNKTFEDYLEESKTKYKYNLGFKIRSDYYDAYFKYSIDDKIIMYESFFGRGITDNPAALFYYLLEDERFKDYTHVWSIENRDLKEKVMAKYEDYHNIIFVETNSLDYFKYLASAKYLINSVTFKDYFVKKPEQIYINTWHGIPIKYVGYDVPKGALNVANIIRNFLMADYLISPVQHMTDIFRKSFKLEGIFPGKIIETGHPRVDYTIKTDKEEIKEDLERFGVNYDPSKKLILYAPTFREDPDGKPDVDVKEYNDFIETISKYVDLDEYQILFKPHQYVYKTLQGRNQLQDNFVPTVIDTNRLLGITDILISDFSSIFYDYLVTDKPVIFYVKGIEEYRKIRGLYINTDELPGPISDDLDQIGMWIKDIKNYKKTFDYKKYTSTKQKINYNDDGGVCARVIDAIFFDNKTYTKDFNNNKIKLLFHTDLSKKNGVTAALHNLLNNLDLEKYDISFYTSGDKVFLQEHFETYKPEIRMLNRIGGRVNNVVDDAKIEYSTQNSITEDDGSEYFPKELYDLEYARCFGYAKFDYIVYFSGSASFWANVFLTQKNVKKLIWIHSQIEHQYYRLVNGIYGFRKNYNAFFKMYKHFDLAVNCSKSVMKINKEYLDRIGVEGNFWYTKNAIDVDRVLNLSSNYKTAIVNGCEYYVEDPNRLIKMPNKNKNTFVAMGQMVEEKNHLSLVEGFAKFNREYPDTELYIIGYGEYANPVKNLARNLGVKDRVILTGNLENPFGLINKCDCFIMPSFYEGQPMVLLEARILKMPIIVSNFTTIKDSACENGQLLIGTSSDEIYEGMKQFMLGNVPDDYNFDGYQYNKGAVEEFEMCLQLASKKEEKSR